MRTLLTGFIALLFCSISITGFSFSKKPVQGYYINNRGDTSWGVFPEKINAGMTVFKFKSSENSSEVNVPVDSCTVIACGDEFFKRWYGKRGMAYIDKMTFDIINNDQFITGSILLKRIFNGATINLYQYHDVKDHYFIEKNDSVQELAISFRYATYREKEKELINPPTYFTTPTYRAQIIALMGDKLSFKQKLLVESCEYEKLDLTRLLKKIDKKNKN